MGHGNDGGVTPDCTPGTLQHRGRESLTPHSNALYENAEKRKATTCPPLRPFVIHSPTRRLFKICIAIGICYIHFQLRYRPQRIAQGECSGATWVFDSRHNRSVELPAFEIEIPLPFQRQLNSSFVPDTITHFIFRKTC